MRRPFKALDRIVALLLLFLAIPVIAFAAACIAVFHRQTPFFGAQRIGVNDRTFTMWKLRTMRGADDGLPMGAPKMAQITSIGGFLRRTRLDELPQLWNVFTGEMALVGIRPPTAWAVSRQPRAFSEILTCPPGLTGLSIVLLATKENSLLSQAASVDDIARLYESKILPCKLQIERHYQRHRSVGMDFWILRATLWVILGKSVMSRTANKAKWDGNEARLQHSFSTIQTQLP